MIYSALFGIRTPSYRPRFVSSRVRLGYIAGDEIRGWAEGLPGGVLFGTSIRSVLHGERLGILGEWMEMGFRDFTWIGKGQVTFMVFYTFQVLFYSAILGYVFVM